MNLICMLIERLINKYEGNKDIKYLIIALIKVII